MAGSAIARREEAPEPPITLSRDLAALQAIESKIAWLSAWTIHNANHLRPSRDGVKVGGHQASSASMGSSCWKSPSA